MRAIRSFRGAAARFRLVRLVDLAANPEATESGSDLADCPDFLRGDLKHLEDRLGRSGFIDSQGRRVARVLRGCAIFGPALLCPLIYAIRNGSGTNYLLLFAHMGVGAYLGLAGWFAFLNFREKDFAREILFRLPLFLESLILVVESGIAVFPALESVISRRERVTPRDPVARIFGIAYRLASHGLPLEQALELVATHVGTRPLRHVLLHLDISANIGGELIPSLRNLSDHSQLEWRLSVEQRVRRLENFVVFPVFVSVIGLVLLTAAVPLVPLVNLHSTLETKHELPLRPQGGRR